MTSEMKQTISKWLLRLLMLNSLLFAILLMTKVIQIGFINGRGFEAFVICAVVLWLIKRQVYITNGKIKEWREIKK